MLTGFLLMKGRIKIFRPKTIVVSFLHLMVLLFKVLLNRTSKHQFLMLHCRTSNWSLLEKMKYLQLASVAFFTLIIYLIREG